MAQKRLKLWIVSKQFSPIFGGATERFRKYAPLFKNKGVDIEVYTSSIGGMKKNEIIDEIKVNRIELKDINHDYGILLNHVSKQILAKNKPDLIIFFSYHPRFFLKMFLFRIFGVKLIFISTMVTDEQYDNFFKRLKNLIYHKISMLPMNKIISSSKVMKRALVKNGFDLDKISVIPNGVDNYRFKSFNSQKELIDKRRLMGFNEKDKIVIFVGSFTERKGVDLLIDAWVSVLKQFQESKLLIVGPNSSSKNYPWFDNAFAEKIKKKIKLHNLSDSVRFIGEITNVEDYLRISDVFILPSLQEGMGNVVFEAMATGLPCILTPYIGLPEEFGSPGKHYILVEHNIDSISDGVIKLLMYEKERNVIGENGKKNILSYSFETVINQYIEVFLKLLRKY